MVLTLVRSRSPLTFTTNNLATDHSPTSHLIPIAAFQLISPALRITDETERGDNNTIKAPSKQEARPLRAPLAENAGVRRRRRSKPAAEAEAAPAAGGCCGGGAHAA